MGAAVYAVLFDLGGVIVEIDFNRVFAMWGEAAGVPAATIASRFSFDAAYRAHERGEISAADYFEALRGTLGLRLSDAQFSAGWQAIFVGEVAGIGALLARAKAHVPLYAFSNSNAAHRDYWTRAYAATLSNFRRVFVSCDLGRRKPEPEAFAAVSGAIGVGFKHLLFLDDTHENVASARALGIQAVHVSSPADVAAALEPYLPPAR